MGRFLVSLAAFAAAWTATTGVEHAAKTPPSSTPLSLVSDSAVSELAARRYWHAARILRADGAAGGSPEDVLVLAKAEAGWDNWPGVLDLLDGADWLQRVGGGSGLYLLGKALEADGRWAEAADAYGGFVTHTIDGEPEAAAALGRRARALWEAGDHAAAVATLGRLAERPRRAELDGRRAGERGRRGRGHHGRAPPAR